MGCNCKAVKTINNVKEIYGDGNDNNNFDFKTLLLKILIFCIVIIFIPVIAFAIIFINVFNKKPVDIRKLLKFKYV